MLYKDGCIVESVGQLCARGLRSGDIDLSKTARTDRLTLGSELHKQLQSERPPEYMLEQYLTNIYEYGGIKWKISGIADGIMVTEKEVMIEEIKTVTSLPKAPMLIHLAQLRTYGMFYAAEHGIERLTLKLTYYSISGKRQKCFETTETADDLTAFYEALLDTVIDYAKLICDRYEKRLPYTKNNAVFPYEEVRLGQNELMQECYRTVKSGKRLFAQAPTGIGKTVSVLYPAVRGLAEGHCDRVFYLTAKAATGREAFSAAKKLYENGAAVKTCVITSKENACLCEEAKKSGRVSSYCNPQDCRYAAGYYDHINCAVADMINNGNGFSRTAMEETAKKYSVCPYELSLDISELCDIIICDYNYVFDPAVYLRRYFSPDAQKANNVFLADEAHNLPDRVRAMYSCELKRSEFEKVYSVTGNTEPELDKALEKVIVFLHGLRKLCRDNLIKSSDGERGFFMTKQTVPGLADIMNAFCNEVESWRKTRREHRLYKAVSDLLLSCRKYITLMDFYDDKFLTYVEILNGDTRVRVFCLDPSGILNDKLGNAKAAVLFSATLTPLDYYTEICGGNGAVTLDLPSPFDEDNLCIASVDSISTRADDRNDKTCRKIAVCIAATVSAKAGNYICYFPSYAFMEKVLSQFKKKYPDVETPTQKRGMTLSQREEFLAEFKNDSGVLRVGFCVLGGSFSEGVDLPGKRLIGSIVIGVGIPGISNERNMLCDYYQLKTERGYDYAYTYPGMNSVMQAAGRVIRRDEDRGIVVLIDDRYSTPQYISMFPKQWNGTKYAKDAATLAEIARRFWKNTKK